MTTMNTSDDFIQVLRNDPNFRATARRELLTAELLEVPTRLSTLEKGIAALVESTETINRRLDSIESDVKRVRRDTDALGESFRREVRAQSSFRGNYAQQAAVGSNYDIARPFADLR